METSQDLITTLAQSAFGISYLYPYQRLVIANILDAIQQKGEEGPHRQLVLLPTGSGKSLCFQLPALLLTGLTVVVYPLLGLISDQQRRLKEHDINAVSLKGGMTAAERETSYKICLSGKARLVLANPEILISPDCLRFLETAAVDHFVVDEAHCVAEWGDTFRPSYLELGRPLAAANPSIVTAFTATASPPILERLATVLFGRESYGLITGNPDRPNIHYSVIPTLSMLRTIRQVVSQNIKPLIIFVQSRKATELVAEDLRNVHPELDVRFYHAGLDKSERNLLESWFLHSPSGVLVATCAYGMGLDKADVRTVVHYGPPASVEAYLQESGRAGRDGKSAKAVLVALTGLGEKANVADPRKNLTTLETLSLARKKIMEDYSLGSGTCRRQYLLTAMGVPASSDLSCSGCDRCDMTDHKDPEGMDLILAAIKKHNRRFTEHGIIQFLGGCMEHRLQPGWGSLGHWHPDEIQEAIRCLTERQILLSSVKGVWKNRLRLAQSGKSSSSVGSCSTVTTGGVSFFRILAGLSARDQGSAM